jgi:membrane fusion protein, multidrug efflux system
MNFKKAGIFLLAMAGLFIIISSGALRAEENIMLSGMECPQKVAVLLETVKTGVFLEYQFSGQGKAEIVAVKSPVSGLLSEIKVSEGSLVDAGQELVVLNAGTDDEIKKLTAEAAKAKKVLTARQNMKVKNEKSIQAAAKDYQKALDLLNNKKAQAIQIVKAPLAGIVHLVMAAGSETIADAVLLEISNPRQMLFPISLTASDKGLLSVGDKFIATTEGLDAEVAAEVFAVSENQAVFGVDNSENKVKEGVVFIFKKPEAVHVDAIVIPTSAIQHDSLGDFVYVAEKKKASKLYVTLGKGREGKTMILQGLDADMQLIVSGFDCLSDGKKIRIVNLEELAKEKAVAQAKLEVSKVTEHEVKAEKKAKTVAIAQTDDSRFRIGFLFERFTINDTNLRAFYLDWFRHIPGIELSIHTMYNVDFWASGKIFTNEQTTTYYANPIKFKLTPISVGLRYRFPKWNFLEPFVGAGLNFYSYSETIEGETDLENTKDSATGFHFQGGTYFHVNGIRFLLGELFLKYNIVKKTLLDLLPDGTDQLDLGGLEIGIGLVVKF